MASICFFSSSFLPPCNLPTCLSHSQFMLVALSHQPLELNSPPLQNAYGSIALFYVLHNTYCFVKLPCSFTYTFIYHRSSPLEYNSMRKVTCLLHSSITQNVAHSRDVDTHWMNECSQRVITNTICPIKKYQSSWRQRLQSVQFSRKGARVSRKSPGSIIILSLWSLSEGSWPLCFISSFCTAAQLIQLCTPTSNSEQVHERLLMDENHLPHLLDIPWVPHKYLLK